MTNIPYQLNQFGGVGHCSEGGSKAFYMPGTCTERLRQTSQPANQFFFSNHPRPSNACAAQILCTSVANLDKTLIRIKMWFWKFTFLLKLWNYPKMLCLRIESRRGEHCLDGVKEHFERWAPSPSSPDWLDWIGKPRQMLRAEKKIGIVVNGLQFNSLIILKTTIFLHRLPSEQHPRWRALRI